MRRCGGESKGYGSWLALSFQHFIDLFLQAPRGLAAGAVLLVLLVPADALIKRCLGRHLVLFVPEFVHALSLSVRNQLPLC